MKNVAFPLSIRFRISTLSNDFSAHDANGKKLAYVRQKMFKLTEEVNVFTDESKKSPDYVIKANQWIDFSATYSFRDINGNIIGSIGRKGWSSLWKARYEIFNPHQQRDFSIAEENGWVKVMDSFLGEIPVLGFLTGYFFHPSYIVSTSDGIPIIRLRKEPSFWGRKFSVNKLQTFPEEKTERILLSLMMMILLERRRG